MRTIRASVIDSEVALKFPQIEAAATTTMNNAKHRAKSTHSVYVLFNCEEVCLEPEKLAFGLIGNAGSQINKRQMRNRILQFGLHSKGMRHAPRLNEIAERNPSHHFAAALQTPFCRRYQVCRRRVRGNGVAVSRNDGVENQGTRVRKPYQEFVHSLRRRSAIFYLLTPLQINDGKQSNECEHRSDCLNPICPIRTVRTSGRIEVKQSSGSADQKAGKEKKRVGQHFLVRCLALAQILA
jgi:hypothetical protein